MTVMASSASVNGAPIRVGSTVRILFTQDLAGANTSTGLVLTYNGVGIPVMVGKNGSLGAFTATDVGSSTYKYLQAYTTLEMAYDGTQFIILGNPAVISNADYTVYTDGSITYHEHISAGQTGYIIIGDLLINYGVVMTDNDSYVPLPHSYSDTNYALIGHNADNSPVRGNKFIAGFGTSVSNSLCNYIAIGKI
jgi:hypothetical protein